MDCRRHIMLIFAICLTVLGLSEGKILHLKHAPSYMVFHKTTLASSGLPSELASALGVSSLKSGAIKSKSVLKRPAANFLLTLLTSKDQEVPVKSLASFPLEWDMPFVDMNQLMNSVQRKFLSQDPLMLNLLSDDQLFDVETSNSIFKKLPTSLKFAKERLLDSDSIVSRHPAVYINSSDDVDSRLLVELQTVQDVVSTLKSNPDSIKTKTPDLMSFTLTGLKAVGDKHGADSPESKEAVSLVSETIDKLTDELKTIYGGNVMVEVIVTPDSERGNVRHTRSLKAVDDDKKGNFTHLNLALDWHQDFPVTFNIIFWLMLILIIFIIFAAYGIWNMNPNLESILYRVPQDESKKTN